LYNICNYAVFCALHDQLASLDRHAQLTDALSLCGSWVSCYYFRSYATYKLCPRYIIVADR